jgi:hypothetical protein
MKNVSTLGKRKKSIDGMSSFSTSISPLSLLTYISLADDVKTIELKDEFNPNAYYVSLTSHAEQFGVEPIRIRVSFFHFFFLNIPR